MSSKRELDRELSLVRREAIPRLYRDGEMEEVESGMLKGGEHEVATHLMSVNILQKVCDGSLTNSRETPLLGSCILQECAPELGACEICERE